MERKHIEQLLAEVKSGAVSIHDAVERLRHLPYEQMGFACVDHHRQVRCGFPEVIYCPGKTAEQVAKIFEALAKKGNNIIATRADKPFYEQVLPHTSLVLRYEVTARMIILEQAPPKTTTGYIAIVTAGTADLPIAAEAEMTAKMLGQSVKLICDVGVAGLHRLFEHIPTLQKANVVIVIAGMEGALASVVGGLVDCPVIAVPTSVGYGANFQGLAALLAMLNSCASGISVVNIDNGFGAAYSASLINMKIEKSQRQT
jgi:NCAIR mutase (PurE)-related protein